MSYRVPENRRLPAPDAVPAQADNQLVLRVPTPTPQPGSQIATQATTGLGGDRARWPEFGQQLDVFCTAVSLFVLKTPYLFRVDPLPTRLIQTWETVVVPRLGGILETTHEAITGGKTLQEIVQTDTHWHGKMRVLAHELRAGRQPAGCLDQGVLMDANNHFCCGQGPRPDLRREIDEWRRAHMAQYHRGGRDMPLYPGRGRAVYGAYPPGQVTDAGYRPMYGSYNDDVYERFRAESHRNTREFYANLRNQRQYE